MYRLFYERAAAKLNLSLAVEEKKKTGLHVLKSLFHRLEWSDELMLVEGAPDSDAGKEAAVRFQKTRRSSKTNRLQELHKGWMVLNQKFPQLSSCSYSLWVESEFCFQLDPLRNSISQALEMYLEEQKISGTTLTLFLRKNIPLQAGLGGGSADAAACLRLMQKWSFERKLQALSDSKLYELAQKIGMDVPFCLFFSCAFLQGTGAELKPLSPLKINSEKEDNLLLFQPPLGFSTREIFQRMDQISAEEKKDYRPQTKEWIESWISAEPNWNCCGNEMEVVLPYLHQPTEEALAQMRVQQGCKAAHMTGSGSACWALFDSEFEASQARKVLQRTFPGFWCVQTRLCSD